MNKQITLISGWAADNTIWSGVENELNGCFDFSHIMWSDMLNSSNPDIKNEEIILCAWSLGALQSLSLFPMISQNIKGLILISGTPRMTACDDWDGVDPQILTTMINGISRSKSKVLRRFHSLCGHPGGRLDELQILQNMSEGFSIEQLEAGLLYLAERDYRNNLGNIKCPVLLIHGTNDHVIPWQHSEYLQDHLSAELHTIKKGTHNILITHPKEIGNLIKDFVNDNN